MRKIHPIIRAFIILTICLSMVPAAFAQGTGESCYITVQRSVPQSVYKAYKIFDATYDNKGHTAYTMSPESPLKEKVLGASEIFNVMTVYQSGQVVNNVVNTDSEEAVRYYALTVKPKVSEENLLNFLSDAVKSIVPESGEPLDPSATEIGNGGSITLRVGEPGYYYVTTSSTGTAVSMTTAAPRAVIVDKNLIPAGNSFKKEIVKSSEDKDGLHNEDAAMGDLLTFKISSFVPLYDENHVVSQYRLKDEMSDGLRLEVNAGDVKPVSDGRVFLNQEAMNRWVSITCADSDVSQKDSFTDYVSNPTLELTHAEQNSAGSAYIASGFTLTYCTYDTETYNPNVPDPASTFDTGKYPVNASISIQYSVYVTENAVYENSNIATINYDITEWDRPDPANPILKSDGTGAGTNNGQQDKDGIYTWTLGLVKLDSGTREPLSGAEFILSGEHLNQVMVSTSFVYSLQPSDQIPDIDGKQLYYRLNTGEYVTKAPKDETDRFQNYYLGDDSDHPDVTQAGPYVRRIETSTEKVQEDNSHKALGTTDQTGGLYFEGLTEGYYTLIEITAPDGYNLLQEPIEITVKWDEDNGFWVDPDFSSSMLSKAEFTKQDQDDVLTIEIENSSGGILPGAGGIGTTAFYLSGVVLVLGAVVVIVARRRTRKDD